MAKNQYYSKADRIAVTADKAYTSGQPVAMGNLAGVAETTVEQGKEFALVLTGAWRVEVTGALAIGAPVYITTAGELTATKGENKPWGVAIAPKASGKGEGIVAPHGKLAI